MATRKPKTEKALQIESLFFKNIRAKLEYELGEGFYTKREVLSILDDIYLIRI